jgi:hypothetical protein
MSALRPPLAELTPTPVDHGMLFNDDNEGEHGHEHIR